MRGFPAAPLVTTRHARFAVLGGAKRYPNGLTGTSGHAPFTSANLWEPTYTAHDGRPDAVRGEADPPCFLYTSDSGTHGAGSPLAVGITNPDDMETQAGWTPGGTPGFSWVTADSAG